MIYLKTSVGMEIRQEDLLISCLRSNFAGGVFTSFTRIAGYRQREPEEVRREIDAFFKREKLNRDNIILGIPRKDVILRYLDLPKEVEDNLKQVMLYQVQSFEPTEEDKLYYDFAPIPNGRQGKRLRVLLAMIRKSTLDAHLELLLRLGVRPAAVTAGAVALANMFLGMQSNGKGKTFILTDLRPGGMELAILRGGALVYAREALRPQDTSWKELLLAEMDLAIGKVRLESEETIESIVMAGEESSAVRQEIEEELPGCELLGSRLRFEMPPRFHTLLQEASMSLGLAYTGLTRGLPLKLNLLPMEHRVHQKRWAYIPTIVLGIAFVAALIGLGLRPLIQERILVRDLQMQIDALKEPVSRVQALRSQADGLEGQISFLEDLLSRRDLNLEILKELATTLPADTYLRTYRNNDCTLMMQGDSAAPLDLIPILEKSPLLKEVAQQGAVFKNAQSGKNTFVFGAKCER